ncbi:hypothetical protein [Desulfuribacillus stibiiarsenatis]|nr:hypothetical protein [Desulfuribacillus stibiiarsenatis]
MTEVKKYKTDGFSTKKKKKIKVARLFFLAVIIMIVIGLVGSSFLFLFA